MDPRVGEIEERLNAATPGGWEWDCNDIVQTGNEWRTVVENTVSCGSYCYGGSVEQTVSQEDKAFITHAPSDVAYLLAELRKRDEALAAVAVLAETWRYKGEYGWGAWQEGHGPDQEGTILDGVSSALRAAIKGDS